MRELERWTGVGRETIRYYIRLGLLPEPQRFKPNVADYDEEHVRRLNVIKRLQQERYLPLEFIKTLLKRRTAGEIEPLPGLDAILATGLGVAADGKGVPLDDVPRLCGLERVELDVLIAEGIVEAPGEFVSELNLSIARSWGRVRAAGFSEHAGFFPEDSRLYLEAVEPLARREVDRFYARVSGAGSVEDAARLGQAGIELLNEFIALLRTRTILRLVGETNALASNEGVAGPPGRPLKS